MFENLTTEQATIAETIYRHKDFSNAINQYDIAGEFMYTQEKHITTRKVRRIIEELIEEGYPIISTPVNPGGGYCWEGAEGEAIECVNRLRRKGIKILLRARWTKRNIKRGQLKIWNM